MTTAFSMTEHEGPIEFEGNGVTWRLLTGPTLGREFTDARPGDVIAALTANPQLRAAVLEGLKKAPAEWDLRRAWLEGALQGTTERAQRAEAVVAKELADLPKADRLRILSLVPEWNEQVDGATELLGRAESAESALAAERARAEAAESMVKDARILAKQGLGYLCDHAGARAAAERILASRPGSRAPLPGEIDAYYTAEHAAAEQAPQQTHVGSPGDDTESRDFCIDASEDEPIRGTVTFPTPRRVLCIHTLNELGHCTRCGARADKE